MALKLWRVGVPAVHYAAHYGCAEHVLAPVPDAAYSELGWVPATSAVFAEVAVAAAAAVAHFADAQPEGTSDAVAHAAVVPYVAAAAAHAGHVQVADGAPPAHAQFLQAAAVADAVTVLGCSWHFPQLLQLVLAEEPKQQQAFCSAAGAHALQLLSWQLPEPQISPRPRPQHFLSPGVQGRTDHAYIGGNHVVLVTCRACECMSQVKG